MGAWCGTGYLAAVRPEGKGLLCGGSSGSHGHLPCRVCTGRSPPQKRHSWLVRSGAAVFRRRRVPDARRDGVEPTSEPVGSPDRVIDTPLGPALW